MFYRFIRRLLLPLFLRRIERVEGTDALPEQGGYLLAANHIDYLDGFFISAVIGRERPRMVTFLSETKNYWWAGGATIPIDPSHKAASLDRALQALSRGTVICIFPEGRRNTTDALLEGKTGLARLAARTGKPVIPVGISGSSSRNFLASVTLLLFRKRPVTLRFGTPIVFSATDPETLTRETLRSMTATIMDGLSRVSGKHLHS